MQTGKPRIFTHGEDDRTMAVVNVAKAMHAARDEYRKSYYGSTGDGSDVRHIEFVFPMDKKKYDGEDKTNTVPIAHIKNLYGKQVFDPEEVVIPGKNRIVLHIDYPLSNPAKFAVHTDDPRGFTRSCLLYAIPDIYEAIYKKEAATSTIKEKFIYGDPFVCVNRNTTDGKYGLKLHFYEDLWIGDMEENTADGCWELNMLSFSAWHDRLKIASGVGLMDGMKMWD